MLRTGLIFGTFMIATLGLIWLMPTPDRANDTSLGDQRQVTRTDAGMIDMPAQDAPAALANIAIPAAAEAAPEPQKIETTAKLLKAVKQQKIRTDNKVSIDEMTQDVLAGLGMAEARKPKPVDPANSEMRQMTSSILANLRQNSSAPAATEEKRNLQTLVIEALRQGAHDDYIDEVINAAAGSGEIAVPRALVTSDGRVDTRALLSNIVRKATGTTTQSAFEEDIVVGGEGVEVRVVQRAGKTEKFNFYTVNKGDSLGAIAVRFYGDVSQYAVIFEANRRILSSPNQIKAGQRLVIPTI